jgi:hypothetical protein
MEAKRFFYRSLLASALVVLGLVLINFQIDLFGLFHSTRGKSISIFSDERSAKYLLAHRYVPENFEGYILGPSLSANINPKGLKELKVYNLSMMGANITEQKAVLEKALERSTPKVVILCLHPYLTADHGMKTELINPKQYYGALGSVGLYKTYAIGLARHFNIMPSKFPKGQFNDYGYNNYNDLLQAMPVQDKIKEQLLRPDAIKTAIDSIAWLEFNEVIDECVAKKIKIIAYFHPLPFVLYDKFRIPYASYKEIVEKALMDKATVIDFTTSQYEFFTKDLTNYIDHGHLSEKGQSYLLPEIFKQANLSKGVESN